MAVNNEVVEDVLLSSDFTIKKMEAIDEGKKTRLTINHDLHPEEDIYVDIVSEDNKGDDIMELQFTGPDVWTDEEAKGVLQEVMDTIVEIIEKALENDVADVEFGSGSGSTSGSVSDAGETDGDN